MATDLLHFTLIQTSLEWEDKAANLAHFETILKEAKHPLGIVVLPEMFSTGFSMKPELLAETMDGPTVTWMTQMAAKHRCILAGSLIIQSGEAYYNRLIWMQPDGQYHHYDKRHLFGFAGEDKHYTPGDKRVIVQVNGWKIALQVCYDLRFPVWSRNEADGFDVLLYVANWPARRSHAWLSLLPARAIENQCYVVAVNRVGLDGNGIAHSGHSCVIDALGETLFTQADKEVVHQITLSKTALQEVRHQFPFLHDRDKFLLL